MRTSALAQCPCLFPSFWPAAVAVTRRMGCRLLDLHDEGTVSLAAVCIVALDECDKMLGLGFAPQLQRLATLLLHRSTVAAAGDSSADAPAAQPPAADAAHGVGALGELAADGDAVAAKRARKRKAPDVALVRKQSGNAVPHAARPQVLLFSATMGEDACSHFGEWLAEDALQVDVAEEASARMSSTVTQVVQVCAEHKKPAKLLKHLQSINAASKGARAQPRVLVFCNKIKVRCSILCIIVTGQLYKCA